MDLLGKASFSLSERLKAKQTLERIRGSPSYVLFSRDSKLERLRSLSMTAKKRVAIVGSGNWGCAIAKIVGQNAQRHNHLEEEVRMWVFEEMVAGRKLTDIINEDHENVKYMPGIKLPRNVIADADVVSATKGAHILIFVLPHQFLGSLCMKIRGNTAPDCIAVSLIKGVHFDETGMVLVSDLIKQVTFCTCFLDSAIYHTELCQNGIDFPKM